MKESIRQYLEKTEEYLKNKLLPFWIERAVEPKYGGFQTNYDREGRRTEVKEKTLLCQGRCLFAFAQALRHGYGWPASRDMLDQGIQFLSRHFKDPQYGGYYWIVDEDGSVLDDSKTIYGHSFLIYAFSEYALATGSKPAAEEARSLFDLLLAKAADIRYGGFFEHFDRRFQLVSARRNGEWHKSLDVHMHLMEAFTVLYELTREARHRQALEQVTELIFDRMVVPDTGCGIAMFTPDWTPIPNEQLATVWGADRFEETRKPPDITSFGHNIELAWLFLHSLDILGIERQSYRSRVEPIFQHCSRYGVDREYGGIYVEGRRGGGVTDTDKEFWQQAEALIGFLDAFALTEDERYWESFCSVHDFVFGKMIHWRVGEWFALLSRQGEVKRDYMGSNWKICYHTLRSMILVVDRLKKLLEAA